MRSENIDAGVGVKTASKRLRWQSSSADTAIEGVVANAIIAAADANGRRVWSATGSTTKSATSTTPDYLIAKNIFTAPSNEIFENYSALIAGVAEPEGVIASVGYAPAVSITGGFIAAQHIFSASYDEVLKEYSTLIGRVIEPKGVFKSGSFARGASFTSEPVNTVTAVQAGGMPVNDLYVDVVPNAINANASSSTSESLPTKLWRQLAAQAEALRKLLPNWDGYDAEPISESIIDEMLADLEHALVGINVSTPDLVPGADGSLQAEWRRKGYTIYFNRDPERGRELSIEHKQSALRLDYFGADALPQLRAWSEQIAD